MAGSSARSADLQAQRALQFRVDGQLLRAGKVSAYTLADSWIASTMPDLVAQDYLTGEEADESDELQEFLGGAPTHGAADQDVTKLQERVRELEAFVAEANRPSSQRPHVVSARRRVGQRQRRKLRDSRLPCTRRICAVDGRSSKDCPDSGSQRCQRTGGFLGTHRHDPDAEVRREADASSGEQTPHLCQLSASRCMEHRLQQWEHRVDGGSLEDASVRRTDVSRRRQDATVMVADGASRSTFPDFDVEPKTGWSPTLLSAGSADLAAYVKDLDTLESKVLAVGKAGKGIVDDTTADPDATPRPKKPPKIPKKPGRGKGQKGQDGSSTEAIYANRLHVIAGCPALIEAVSWKHRSALRVIPLINRLMISPKIPVFPNIPFLLLIIRMKNFVPSN